MVGGGTMQPQRPSSVPAGELCCMSYRVSCVAPHCQLPNKDKNAPKTRICVSVQKIVLSSSLPPSHPPPSEALFQTQIKQQQEMLLLFPTLCAVVCVRVSVCVCVGITDLSGCVTEL